MNVQVDTNKIYIYSYWKIGVNEFGHAIYHCSNNELNLKIQQTENWGIDPSAPGTGLMKRNKDGEIMEGEYEIKEHNPFYNEALYGLL